MNQEPKNHENFSDQSLSAHELTDYLYYLGDIELRAKVNNPAVDYDSLLDDISDMSRIIDLRIEALFHETGANTSSIVNGLATLAREVRQSQALTPSEKSKRISYYEKLQDALMLPDEARREMKELEDLRDQEEAAAEDSKAPLPDSEPQRSERQQQAHDNSEREHASQLVNWVVEAFKDKTQIHSDTEVGFRTYANDNLDGTRMGTSEVWNKLRRTKLFRDTQSELDVTKIPVEMIAFTPAVGVAESTTYVDYTFNPSGQANRLALNGKMPEYREIGGSRLGNLVSMRLKLPDNVAVALKATVEEYPDVARELLDKVVLGNGGKNMDEARWTKARSAKTGRGRPPFEGLPAGWKLFILEPDTDSEAQYALKPISF